MSAVPTLYSYVVAADSGVAPNPLGGMCSLVVCKPEIRLHATVGDWVAGTGAGERQGRLVYAMRVTDKMTMGEYYTRFPDRADALYDFTYDPPHQREEGPHGAKDYDRDIRGKYALLSDHFYYFGKDAPTLPEHLRGMVKSGRGHRSVSNAPYVEPFISWVEHTYEANCIYGYSSVFVPLGKK